MKTLILGMLPILVTIGCSNDVQDRSRTSSDGVVSRTEKVEKCSNFSGNWQKVSCENEVETDGVVEELDIDQKTKQCGKMTLFAKGDENPWEVIVDGEVHESPVEGASYLAKWDRNLYPNGDHLYLNVFVKSFGITLSAKYQFEETKDKSQVATLTLNRTFNGKTEELNRCKYKKNK